MLALIVLWTRQEFGISSEKLKLKMESGRNSREYKNNMCRKKRKCMCGYCGFSGFENRNNR